MSIIINDAERPVSVYNFEFEITSGPKIMIGDLSKRKAYFTSVSGLESEIEVTEFRVGGGAGYKDKLPMMPGYSDIILRIGVAEDDWLDQWYNTLASNIINVSNCVAKSSTLRVFDRTGQNVIRAYKVYNSYPRKLSLGELKSDSSDVLITECTLAVYQWVPIKASSDPSKIGNIAYMAS